jgi:hypothetical protein
LAGVGVRNVRIRPRRAAAGVGDARCAANDGDTGVHRRRHRGIGRDRRRCDDYAVSGIGAGRRRVRCNAGTIGRVDDHEDVRRLALQAARGQQPGADDRPTPAAQTD